MQIASVGANFTANEADELRRALATFRHVGTISSLRGRFLDGMRKNCYPKEFTDRCFSQIEGFGTYGFPEAHAISFANLVYASAWIKCHYPDVFCAALLNSQPMGFYAPAQLVRDVREHGVEVRPIDVNHSHWETTLEPVENSSRHAIRLGLHMVSGLPEKDAPKLMAARGLGYRTPGEIAGRAGCSRRALNRLSPADTFASMTVDRRQALWKTSILDGKIPPLFAGAELFGDPKVDLPPATGSQEVLADYLATGLTLREYPLTFLRPRFKARLVTTAADLKKTTHGKTVLVAGLVLFRQHPQTAKDTIFVTIEDETGAANLIVWKQVHEKYHAAVYHGKLLACQGVVQREGQVLHVVARRVWGWSAQLKHLDPLQGAPVLPVRSRDFR